VSGLGAPEAASSSLLRKDQTGREGPAQRSGNGTAAHRTRCRQHHPRDGAPGRPEESGGEGLEGAWRSEPPRGTQD
jgi:hypothetical protein